MFDIFDGIDFNNQSGFMAKWRPVFLVNERYRDQIPGHYGQFFFCIL